MLSIDEQRELEALVGDYGRRLHEARVREYARQRDISIEGARSEMDQDLDRSISWWKEFESDSARRVAIQQAPERQRQATER